LKPGWYRAHRRGPCSFNVVIENCSAALFPGRLRVHSPFRTAYPSHARPTQRGRADDQRDSVRILGRRRWSRVVGGRDDENVTAIESSIKAGWRAGGGFARSLGGLRSWALPDQKPERHPPLVVVPNTPAVS
jgi:hypothetical protein